MNIFALIVIVLQLLAAGWYVFKDHLILEGLLWLTYGIGNLLLVLIAIQKLKT